jgi:RND family efflux transporter MFP subunit
LSAAEKTARDAEAQLSGLQRAGAGGDNRIHSDMSGVIAKVAAQNGQIVPSGGPLVEIVAENEIEVKLGVEAEDLSAAQEGASITVVAMNDPTATKVDGTIRLVTRRIDPTTRLVDVYVALPEGTKLLLDGYVRGEIQRTEKNALVVPRPAVLPNESREFEVFTVANNRATKHTVKIGAENINEIQVTADDLHEGDPVVSVGNYELEDGMAVEIKK